MNITSGELAAVVTLIGAALSMLGVTGVDAGMVNAAANGVIAIITFVAAIYAWYQHRNAVIAAGFRE